MLIALLAHRATAASPEIDAIYPAGGMAGETVELSLIGKPGTAPLQVWCNQPGISATVGDSKNTLALSIDADVPTGRCWLRIFNAEGASRLIPFVVGTLPDMMENEPNNEVDDANQTPSQRCIIHGTLGRTGDVDTFALPLLKEETVVVSVEANQVLGSEVDTVLQVVSPAGFVLHQNNDDRGLDPQLVFTAPASNRYFIRLFGFPATPDRNIRLAGASAYVYRMSVTTGPFIDHAFPLAVEAGESKTVQLAGWNIPDDLNVHPIDANDSHNDWATISHPQFANTVKVDVSPYPVFVAPDPSVTTDSTTMTLPALLCGCIAAPNEAQEFRFQAEKDQRLRFRVSARDRNSPLDPVLRFYGPDGKLVKKVDDSTRNVFDPELTHRVKETGEHSLQITDLHQRGGFRYVYCITADFETPDYSLSVETDRFQFTDAESLEIPVKVVRERGFDAEIEVSAVGLPKGISADLVRSLPKGDTEKLVAIKLKRAAPGSSLSSTIRIVGKSLGDEARGRVATAPIAKPVATTSDLWVTVLKSKPTEQAKTDEKKQQD